MNNRNKYKREKLFGDTVSPNKPLFGDTVSPNKPLFGDTVSPNNTLFGDRVLHLNFTSTSENQDKGSKSGRIQLRPKRRRNTDDPIRETQFANGLTRRWDFADKFIKPE